MLLDQLAQGYEGSFVFRPIRQKSRFCKVNVSGVLFPTSPEQKGKKDWGGDLTENLGNSGWKVNRKATFRKFQPKIEEYVLR